MADAPSVRTITHRELLTNSSQVLEAVKRSESFLVTNGGEPAAVLSPPTGQRSVSRPRDPLAGPFVLPDFVAPESVQETLTALRDDQPGSTGWSGR